jgi:hypothetical protein
LITFKDSPSFLSFLLPQSPPPPSSSSSLKTTTSSLLSSSSSTSPSRELMTYEMGLNGTPVIQRREVQ